VCRGFVGFRRTISGGRPYCSLPILARTIGFSAGAPPAARSSRLLAACGDGVARYPIRYLWGREGPVVSTCMLGVARYPIRYQREPIESNQSQVHQGSSGSSGFVRVRQGSSGRAPIELPLALESFVRRGAKPLGAHTDGTPGRTHVPTAGRRSARRLRVEDAREGRVVLFAHPAREVDLIPVGKGEAPW